MRNSLSIRMKTCITAHSSQPFRRRFLGAFWLATLTLAVLAGGFMPTASVWAQSKPVPTSLESYQPFAPEAVDTFRELLIQDGGRVKPMDTYARFTQLALFGRRSARFSTTDGEEHKIDSAEWLMNLLFRPQVAKHLPSFVVDDSDAVVEFGVTAKKKRDRYSYREIAESGGSGGPEDPTSRAKLAQEAQQYAQQKQKYEQAKDKQSDEAAQYELSHIQEMVLILARNVSSFEYHAGQMAFAQQGDILSAGLMPPKMMTLAKSLDAMELIEKMPAMPMASLVQMIRSQPPGAEGDAELLSMSLQLLFFYSQSADTMAIFPPPRGKYPQFTAEDILKPKVLTERFLTKSDVDLLSGWLWQQFDAGTQKNLQDESADEEQLRATLSAALNKVISSGTLIYEKKRFSAGSLEKETEDLMSDKPEGDTLVELNRMLLNDYYRSELESPAKEWLTVGDVMILALESEEMRPWARERLKLVQDLARAAGPDQGAEFQEKLTALKAFTDAEAETLRVGERAKMEVDFYSRSYFSNALWFCFVPAFVFLCISWLSPGSQFGRWTRWVVIGFTVIGLVLVVIGIGYRCVIRQRAPISNLYETIIFIAATCVFVGLFLEWITRITVGLAAAVVLGLGLMFLSVRYEAMEATDTMGQLQAVLDTNFWLWTHVTIINIGYGAGMLGAIVSHFWILTKALGLGHSDKNIYKTITRMVYGIVCFCLLFSLVGTVLGGIWANYSWGRFWGWDPKENGALMICLFSLAMLHARMGGYIRDLGMHITSIFLGMLVTFSWWGVNNLGVGLHSYGFVEGVWINLFIFWGIEVVFMILAVIVAKRPLVNVGKMLEGRTVSNAGTSSAS
jgi:ABC-type transport system involved in cytochrome c biogenesis permease subunit